MTARSILIIAALGFAVGLAVTACLPKNDCTCPPVVGFAPGEYRVVVPEGLGIRDASLSGDLDDLLLRYSDVSGRQWDAYLRAVDSP